MHFRRFALSACALLACTHLAPTSRVPERQPAISIHARSAVVAPIRAPRLLRHDAGAASYFAVGGVRARLRGGDVVVGEQPFASELIGAAKTADERWLFVTASGLVARSDDFVGPLTYLQSLRHTVVRAFPWEGGLAVVYPDGSARKVGTVPGGATVLLPPTVLQSPAAVPPAMGDTDTAIVATAVIDRFPNARLALPSSALLGTGEIAMRGGSHLYFATARAGGAFDVTSRVALPAETAGDCDLSAWASRALITCPAVPPGMPIRDPVTPFVADTESVTRVGNGARVPLMAGREGHTLTLAGPCPEGESGAAPVPNATATVSCTLDRERDWREWTYPRVARLLDVYDGFALFAEETEASTVLRLYEIDLARVRRVPLSDATVEITRAGFTPDGRIMVLASSGPANARRSQVGVGPMGDLIVLRPLGFEAQDASMADVQRGFAAGLNAADLAETTDGGLSWQRVDAVLDGEGTQFSLAQDEPGALAAHARRIGERVECSTLACRVPGKLVHRWGPSVELVPAMGE